MTTVTLGTFDGTTGELVMDAEVRLTDGARFVDAAAQDLASVLAEGVAMGCANPDQPQHFPIDPDPTEQTLTVRDYWHNSFVEGPGRRSVVRVQGCPIRCRGCWVPETHDAQGQIAGVSRIAQTLLDPSQERDGVTILGGEPFAQPDGLLALIRELRALDPELHILVYSGYPLGKLQVMGYDQPAIDEVLEEIDILIDGPYIQAMADTAGPWTGSGNQNVRYLSGRMG